MQSFFTTIKKRTDFVDLSKRGKVIRTPLFLFVYKVHDKFELGVTVTKKVGGAVVRNKIKRRIKSIFQQIPHLNQYKIKCNIIANRGVEGCDFLLLSKKIKSCLEKAPK